MGENDAASGQYCHLARESFEVTSPNVLFWGRAQPEYSRNRILRKNLADLGWRIHDFSSRFSPLGDIEARIRCLMKPDLVWVPCFRQRDVPAARRWSSRYGVPLLFDPLISSYDKQVDERGKYRPESRRAARILRWETALFQAADLVLADTPEHARYFTEMFGLPAEKVSVVPVGAEESLFFPGETAGRPVSGPQEVLFFGSFIPLQGPQVIARAARIYRGPPVTWRFIGDGPLVDECRHITNGLENVHFEPWVPYTQLGDDIRHADILLGIFGTTPKSGRVIPNKVYQALACGKPVITRRSPAYPPGLTERDASGISWVAPGDPEALGAAVAALAGDTSSLAGRGASSRAIYEEYFSMATVRTMLRQALTGLC
jgi:glycosyltransferase involved in cell wall biosynthesis